MARNTLSSRFRWVDIHESGENKFVDEQEVVAAVAGEPGPDPSEVDGLLWQGDMLQKLVLCIMNQNIVPWNIILRLNGYCTKLTNVIY
uniref:Uncharacterized protein n=1 Tax=Oryctolagus cuniculus TaxID=9986 RepID=A0A5F9CBM6_RABIT